MTSKRDLRLRLEEAKSIVLSARDLLLEGFSWTPGSDPLRAEKLGISTKSSFLDLVTIYDKKVESHLVEALSKSFAGELIIGEESTAAENKTARQQAQEVDAFWVIDPIDGTTNFSRSYPFFCSTLAYLEKKNGRFEPMAAVTFNPVSGELFSASKGGGAWLGRHPLKVSPVQDPKEALFTTGFASLRHSDNKLCFEIFSEITPQTLGVRRDGSAALDLAYLAAGRIDGYWENGLSIWDVAAGILLIQEAGGLVTRHDGNPIDLFDGEILSSNERLHKWLMNKIKQQ